MPWCGYRALTGFDLRAAGPRRQAHVEAAAAGSPSDQIGPPRQDTARLWSADRLSARVDDEIGALGDEALQVAARRQGGRGVDDHRQAVAMGDLGHLRQRERAGRVEDRPEERRGALGDGGFDLPGVGPASARIPEVAGLDEGDPRRANGVVVGISMPSLDDNFVLQLSSAWSTRRVEPGDTGGVARSGRAARLSRNPPRRRSPGDHLAGGLLELVHDDVALNRRHCRQHSGATRATSRVGVPAALITRRTPRSS